MGSDTSIVKCARVSYDQGSKGEAKDWKLLRYLFENKHSSPFEMAKIQFEVKLPIFVARQLIRHRMQNLNEVSARYTVLPEEFYVPERWRVQDTKNKQGSVDDCDWQPWHDQCILIANKAYQNAWNAYLSLLDEGVAREQARIVLPLNTYTKWITCFDLNNFTKLCVLRIHPHAQYETCLYVEAMLDLAGLVFPWTTELIKEVVYDEAQS